MLGVVPTTALPCKRLTGRPGGATQMSDRPHKVPIPGPLAPLRSTVKQSVYRLLSGIRIAVWKKRAVAGVLNFP